MKSKYLKLPLFPPVIRRGLYTKQITNFHRHIEKCCALLAVFPSKQYTYILQIHEAYSSLVTQGIDFSFENFFELKNKKKSSPFLQRIENYMKAFSYIDSACDREWGSIEFFEKLQALAEKDFCKIDEDVGKIRHKQNWMGKKNCTIDQAIFFPPHPDKVVYLMEELRSFLKEDLEPVLQLGIAVAQFLIIHPFMDGNGRVARLFLSSHFKQKGLVNQPILFLSPFFLKHRITYLNRLCILTFERRWKPWLDFYFQAVEKEAINLHKRLRMLTCLYLAIRSYLFTDLSPQSLEKLLSFLFQNPVFLRKNLRDELQFSSYNADKILKKLRKKRYLTKNKRGYFVFSPLLTLMQKKGKKTGPARKARPLFNKHKSKTY